jgi:hypothetical protein
VQEVAPEDDGVFRGEDGVDPARRDEEGVTGFELNSLAVLDEVTEKGFVLIEVKKRTPINNLYPTRLA